MQLQPRPFIILPAREQGEDLRAQHIKLVPHACEACGELVMRGVLCTDCEDRTRPHDPEDPYDVLGGDHGTE
jgi:hypothetical protein